MHDIRREIDLYIYNQIIFLRNLFHIKEPNIELLKILLPPKNYFTMLVWLLQCEVFQQGIHDDLLYTSIANL